MDTPEFVTNAWYVAAPSAAVARAGMHPVRLLGIELLLLRDQGGQVSALLDFCPHRGIPLRHGHFDGRQLECCYHGWRFDCAGQCLAIPSLEEPRGEAEKIRVRRFEAAERMGMIWVYVPDAQFPATPPPPPALPEPLAGAVMQHVTSCTMPCAIDHAVIGLMDPAHGPFVHRAWWWRTRRSMHLKRKEFAPVEGGFSMLAHRPSSNSRAYAILGGTPQTEIRFELPARRLEHIRIGRHHVVLLTALTPVDATATVLHQFAFTTMPLLRALMPLLRLFGRAFIRQDLRIVQLQQQGLRPGHPSLLLLGDADAQALWYFRIKKEALAAIREQRPFENPLKPRTLSWRS